MQSMSFGELKHNLDKAWQYSQNHPVIIRQGENQRVLLSFDEFVKITKSLSRQHKTNAERIGMSLDDLARLDDDIEFGFDETANEVVL